MWKLTLFCFIEFTTVPLDRCPWEGVTSGETLSESECIKTATYTADKIHRDFGYTVKYSCTKREFYIPEKIK